MSFHVIWPVVAGLSLLALSRVAGSAAEIVLPKTNIGMTMKNAAVGFQKSPA